MLTNTESQPITAEVLDVWQDTFDSSTQGVWLDTVTPDGKLVVELPGMASIYMGDMEETEGVDHADARIIALSHNTYNRLLSLARAALAVDESVYSGDDIAVGPDMWDAFKVIHTALQGD